MIAPLLLGGAVFLLTLALWPKGHAPVSPRFIEDPRAPRTLH